jgi:CRISPR-associated protein Cmr3
MKTWIIEPRDPLIARDGRPFTADPGARAKSLLFPFPSTTTGTVRTRYGFTQGDFNDPTQKADLIAKVKGLGVKGPLLVELTGDSEIKDWLLPAPADAVLFEAGAEQAHFKQLVPLSLPEGARTDLPDDLRPVGFASYAEVSKRKPHKDAPRFWRKEHFLKWLENPQDQLIAINEPGHSGPTAESRVHVGINPDTQAAIDGALYQTSGLEFTHKLNEKPLRLALAVMTSVDLPTGFAPLGGEQRLSHWRASSQAFPDACPAGIRNAIKQNNACRVVLLTPAHFAAGFRPDWLLQSRHGISPQLIAAAVGRPQVVSGWDYELRRPKPTRRLAPAGSVYFLKLDDSGDIDQWIDTIWMNCVSDDDEGGNPAQTRLDGFGLAALGTWSGEGKAMEVSQ